MKYRPEVDGLRALAILSVLIFHLGYKGLPGGFAGVDVFFVISGYLITKVIWDNVAAGTFSYQAFWERRVRRLFPALFVVYVFCLVAGPFLLLPDDLGETGLAVVIQAFLSTNVLFWRTVSAGYFGDPPEIRPLLHTWSLSVEEQFYLFFPMLLAMGRRKGVALVAGFSFAASLMLSTKSPVFAFFMLPCRAWELLLGSMTAALGRPKSSQFTDLLGLGMILYFMLTANQYDPWPGYRALLPCVGTATLLWGMTEGSLVGRFFSTRPVIFVGLMSYSLYLWHWPLIAFAQYTQFELPSGAQALIVALTFLLSYLSLRLVETPFRTRKLLASRSSLFQAFFAANLFLMALGLATYRYSLDRWTVESLHLRCPKKNATLALEIKADKVPPLIGDVRTPPSFVLWGDSHAMSIAPALDAAGRRLHLSGYQATLSGTPPLLPSRQKVLETILKEQKIDYVFMAGYWETYTKQDEKDRLVKTIAFLRAKGVTPVLVLDIPNYSFDVPRRLSTDSLYSRPDSKGVSLQENRGFQRWLVELAKGCLVMEPASYLAGPDGVCRLKIGDSSLYRDSHHLSPFGGNYVTPMFLDFFESNK
ncbi:MAG: acyltransferase [Candidatus Eremiobacteraeota bacterium]|nr:acyltransferase [Candidatus Eremiobacteraeota bacterium]